MTIPEFEVRQALRRVKTFAISHAGDFPAGSLAGAAFARLDPLLAEIGEGDLQSGFPASAATGAKAGLLDELWEDLKAVSNTARTIARQEPGFAADFRLGDDTQRGILASAEAFVTALEDPARVAKFVAYDLPASFVADLKRNLAAISSKSLEQTGDYLGAAGETARIRALIAEGRDLLKRLDTSVRNRFRHQPEILAQWRAAARIHRPVRPESRPSAESPAPASPSP